MLAQLYINNYKTLVEFDIAFSELCLLIGSNGSGKSAIFDAFCAVRRLLGGTSFIFDNDVFPTKTLTKWQLAKTQTIEFQVRVDQQDLTYRLVVSHAHSRPRIEEEILSTPTGSLFEFRNGEVQLYRDDHTRGAKYSSDWHASALARVLPGKPENRTLTAFVNFVRGAIVCRLNPAAMQTEAVSEDEYLAIDGNNFVAWYRALVQEQQYLVADYFKTLSEIIPGFTSVSLEKVGQDTRAFRVDFQGRYLLSFDELSDGQRALFVLYALIRLTANSGRVLLIDEPENFVALAEIQPWLMLVTDYIGVELPQVILTSHNPEVMNFLTADRSVFLTREASGNTRVSDRRHILDNTDLTLSEVIARGWEE